MNKNFCKILFLLFVGVYLIFSASCTKCDCNSCECIVPIEESLAGTSWKYEAVDENSIRIVEVFTFLETEYTWKHEHWGTDPETGEEFYETWGNPGTYIYVKPSVMLMLEAPGQHSQVATIGNDILVYPGGNAYHKQ